MIHFSIAPVVLSPAFLLCIYGKVVNPLLTVNPATSTDIGLIPDLVAPLNLPQEISPIDPLNP